MNTIHRVSRRVRQLILPESLGAQFWRVWISVALNNLADGILIAAGPLIVAVISNNDPFLIGLAAAIQRIPWLLFGLFAGVYSDRLDRRVVIIATVLARMLLLGALGIALLTGTASVWLMMVVLFCLGTAETFGDTASGAIIPSIVPSPALGPANARIIGTMVTTNQLIGPVLGGLLFLVAMVFPIGVQVLLMALAVATFWGIRLPEHRAADAPPETVMYELRSGLRWVWGNKAIRTLLLLITVFNLSFGASFGILVLYATQWLGIGEVGYTWLLAASALGAILGTVIFPTLERRLSYTVLLRIGLCLETLMHFVLAFTHNAVIALITLFIFGVHTAVWSSTSVTIKQRVVPLNMMGRVSGVYMIGLTGTLAIGQVLGGWVASVFSLTATYASAGILALLTTIVVWQQIAHLASAGQYKPQASGSETK